MFTKVLVANRGEIAVRIMRTLREMGIASVAVHSTADASALHVLSADEAICIGSAEPKASYLDGPAIIQAALKCGAQAIHPGYGFLSERADFARAVADAGLAFVGPPAEVIALLGDKIMARNLMQRQGLPIIPGMLETQADPTRLAPAAESIGYPVLIKAAAGGGGKGMRIVGDPDGLIAAAEAASREAGAAFGDGSIYLEKYLERPRHIEFQILADSRGNAVHLFERECSIQRRHQKLIEETPSVALDGPLRQAMGEAALTAARAAGYVNAGTVEFLLDEDGAFYFLEVNTRLQVEHPVTELTVGLDLVRWQLLIAAGEPLPFGQSDIRPRGHAIECRIYAEDPRAGFLPSPGKILLFQPAQGPSVRFDGGIYEGAAVPVEYDPILGKLIVWAEDRSGALQRMERALAENVILGVHTTTGFLLDVIKSLPFREGRTHTGFIEEHFAGWRISEAGLRLAELGYVADRLTGAGARSSDRGGETSIWLSPWQRLGSWDLVGR